MPRIAFNMFISCSAAVSRRQLLDSNVSKADGFEHEQVAECISS